MNRETTVLNIYTQLFLFFILLLLGYSCSSQKSNYSRESHGTYIIAGIARDGIVVIADSRTSFQLTDGSIYAYYDKSNKIYQFQDLIITMAGARSFSDIYMPELLRLFSIEKKTKIPADSFFTKFFSFAKGKLNQSDYLVLLNNQFIVCGYKGSIPFIKWKHGEVFQEFVSIGSYITNNIKDKSNPALSDLFLKNDAARCLNVMSKSLSEFIKKANTDTISNYGLDLIAAIRTPNKIGHFGSPKYNFSKRSEFLEAYKKNEIEMHYRFRGDSTGLRRILLLGE